MEPKSLPPRAETVVARLRRHRRWLLFILGGVAVALLPWSAFLSTTLPSTHAARHWQVAWVGLDLFEAAALIATFVAVLRNSPAVAVLSSIAGTALLIDAWFDLVTSGPGRDFHWALFSALLGVLPLAALCYWIAFEVEGIVGAIAAEEQVWAADPRPTLPPNRRAEGRQRART